MTLLDNYHRDLVARLDASLNGLRELFNEMREASRDENASVEVRDMLSELSEAVDCAIDKMDEAADGIALHLAHKAAPADMECFLRLTD